MTQEETLKYCIKNTEERYISYKKMLEGIFKDKVNFPIGDEFVDWYKELLREGKNEEEGYLKKLQLEITNLRQGMNPPFCYPKYKRKNNGDI